MQLRVMAQTRINDPCRTKASADFPLGVPFNIASYSALTQILAEKTGMIPGDFIWTGGDCHVYTNQIETLQQQLTRQPKALPWLDITYGQEANGQVLSDIENYDFDVIGYDPHPGIKFPPPAV